MNLLLLKGLGRYTVLRKRGLLILTLIMVSQHLLWQYLFPPVGCAKFSSGSRDGHSAVLPLTIAPLAGGQADGVDVPLSQHYCVV